MADGTDQTGASTGTTLDSRYGRTRGDRRRLTWLYWSLGAFLIVVFGAWVVWAGVLDPGSRVEGTDIGHTIEDAGTVSISYQVTAPAGEATMCALQAQDEDHSIVGWKIVDIPASDSHIRQFSDTVRTSKKAVTGLIYRCWLP